MEMAVEKAASHGLGAVAVRNSTHFGIAGYYSRMASDAGMIGMTFTNARPAVAPTFSVQPLFGTNPIAVAAPSDEAFPFWFDAATSISQRGKVEVKARSGEPLPPGVAVDEVGEPITDAALLLRKLSDGTGALLPLGGAGEALSGYKGYALATVGEIFCAALQQGTFLSALAGGVEGGIARETRLGHFFLAMRVDAFVPLPAFRKAVGDMMRELRAARKAPGADRIWTPGEKEYETMLARDRSGIPVNQELLAELCELRDRLALEAQAFPLAAVE
jgi:LDH2 family malate/lactate/ureidoglycolate dehydrogenase